MSEIVCVHYVLFCNINNFHKKYYIQSAHISTVIRNIPQFSSMKRTLLLLPLGGVSIKFAVVIALCLLWHLHEGDLHSSGTDHIDWHEQSTQTSFYRTK